MKEDRGGKVFVDSTRVGGATVVAAYSPRVRPGVPVSFPLAWDELDDVTPADFTVHTARERSGIAIRGPSRCPSPSALSADLIAEGHAIPVARVQAMHEGKRPSPPGAGRERRAPPPPPRLRVARGAPGGRPGPWGGGCPRRPPGGGGRLPGRA